MLREMRVPSPPAVRPVGIGKKKVLRQGRCLAVGSGVNLTLTHGIHI